MKSFNPARLKDARGDRRIELVAGVAGVSSQTIRNWESGRSVPDADSLAAIAHFLRKPISYFFTRASAA